MFKRYANLAVAYAAVAMILGVFYREFTKFSYFFITRGFTQVWGTELGKGLDSFISEGSRIGHMLLGVCIILLLLKIKSNPIRGGN